MACYCLKGENNLDMPGKICPEILDAVLPIELLLNSKYFLFQITGIGIFGVLCGDSTIYSISRYYLVFYVLCKPRGGLEVSESGPTSLLKDSRLAQPPGSQICCNT